MKQLNLSRIAISLQIKISAEAIEQHSVASPYIVGEELARQVAAYVQHERLGYYPALEYFRTVEAIEPDLLNAAESISWLVCGLVQQELKARLRAVFSNLKIESIQTVAYTMPAIKPGSSNALHDLAQHYTPDLVRIILVASSIHRHDNDPEVAMKLARHQICRWLKDRFSSLEITSMRCLTAD